MNRNGKIIGDFKDKLERRQEYIQKLLRDEKPELVLQNDNPDNGPDVTKEISFTSNKTK